MLGALMIVAAFLAGARWNELTKSATPPFVRYEMHVGADGYRDADGSRDRAAPHGHREWRGRCARALRRACRRTRKAVGRLGISPPL